MGAFKVNLYRKTMWPSGLRRQLQALVRKGVGSNPTVVITFCKLFLFTSPQITRIIQIQFLSSIHCYGV